MGSRQGPLAIVFCLTGCHVVRITVYSLLRLASFTSNMHVISSMSFLGSIAHFFSELHNTPLFLCPFFASKMRLCDQLVSMNLASHTQGLLTHLRTTTPGMEARGPVPSWWPTPPHPVLFACLGRNFLPFSLGSLRSSSPKATD